MAFASEGTPLDMRLIFLDVYGNGANFGGGASLQRMCSTGFARIKHEKNLFGNHQCGKIYQYRT